MDREDNHPVGAVLRQHFERLSGSRAVRAPRTRNIHHAHSAEILLLHLHGCRSRNLHGFRRPGIVRRRKGVVAGGLRRERRIFEFLLLAARVRAADLRRRSNILAVRFDGERYLIVAVGDDTRLARLQADLVPDRLLFPAVPRTSDRHEDREGQRTGRK